MRSCWCQTHPPSQLPHLKEGEMKTGDAWYDASREAFCRRKTEAFSGWNIAKRDRVCSLR